MVNSDAYTKTNYDGNGISLPDGNTCDFHISITAINTTGEDLFIFLPTSTEPIVVPFSRAKGTCVDPSVKITLVHRSGRRSRPSMYVGNPSVSNTGYRGYTVCVPIESLADQPVFVRELAMTVTRAEHIARAKKVDLYSEEFQASLIRDLKDDMRKSEQMPIVVNCNIHDKRYDRLYVSVNGFMTAVKIHHRPELPETLDLCLNRYGEGSEVVHFKTSDFSDPKKMAVSSVVVDGSEWILGTDREAVQKAILEKTKAFHSRYTETEVIEKVESTTAQYQAQLEHANARCENQAREIENLRKRVALAEEEAKRANDEFARSHDQIMKQIQYGQTLAESQAKYNELVAKSVENEKAREREAERSKAEATINEAKVKKEQLSVQSAEATTLANVVKSAAVIVPALLGLTALIVASKGSASKQAFAMVNSVPCLRSSLTVVKSAVSSIITNAANTIARVARSFASWVFG